MNEPKSSESESDLSSNSSWTLLDDPSDAAPKPETEQTGKKDVAKVPSVTEVQGDVVNKTSKSSIPGHTTNHEVDVKSSNHSHFILDQFFEQRLLRYDYSDESEATTDTSCRDDEMKQKRHKHCRTETIHILSLTCSLLVLTGLSLLCILFPDNINEKIIQNIENSSPAVSDYNKYDAKEIVDSLNRTQELMKLVTETKLLDGIKSDIESKLNNGFPKAWDKCDEDMVDIPAEDDVDEAEPIVTSFAVSSVDDAVEQLHATPDETGDEVKLERGEIGPFPELSVPENPPTFKLSTLKKFLSKTSVTILSCILHNICVLKAVKYFYSKQNARQEEVATQQPSKPCDSDQHQSPPNSVNKSQDVKMTPKVGSKRKVKVSKVSKKVTVKESPKHPIHKNIFSEQFIKPAAHEPLPFNFSVTDSAKYHTNSQVHIRHNNESLFGGNFLKGEGFQRKPGELERYKRKTEMFTEQHRKKIKVLRNEFHQELADAKKGELEAAARSRRISCIKENFVLRLKQHREKYLNDLKQLKEERQLLLRELCSSNKNPHTVESRDVAVGNYVVPITGLCAFEEKLKLLKEKESNNMPTIKSSVPLFSGFKSECNESKLCSYQSSPCFKIEKLKMERYIPFNRNYTQNAKKRKEIDENDHRNKLAEMRHRYLQRQTNILNEYSRLMSDEVNNMECASKLDEPCVSLLDEIILEAVDMVQKNDSTSQGHDLVHERAPMLITKKRAKLTDGSCAVADSDVNNAIAETAEVAGRDLDLYAAMFEKQAKTIKLRDTRRVRPEHPDIVPVHTKYLSGKQDPQRCYVEKVVRGH